MNTRHPLFWSTLLAALLATHIAHATPPGEYATPLEFKTSALTLTADEVLGESLIGAARQTELAGSHERAAALYATAAAHHVALREVLLLRAGQNMLRASTLPSRSALETLLGKALLQEPIPHMADVQLELALAAYPTQVPSEALLMKAVALAREPTCERLMAHYSKEELLRRSKDKSERAALRPLLDVMHGHCEEDLEEESTLDSLGLTVSASARTHRADLLISHVHFNATLKEIARIERAAQTADERCETDFLLASATYRILKTRSKAQALYQSVADTCTQPGEQGLIRRRSLYALGKRAYDTGQLDDSGAHFALLLKDFPKASHADDAIMYLARIARDRGDRARQLELMNQALTELPEGDMVHEIVWEALEPLVREERDQEFLDTLDALPLPTRDDEYFSQGRLEHFKAAALMRLGKKTHAIDAWTALWLKYPFSFYGYLGWIRASESGVDPTRLLLGRDREQTLDWLFDAAWLRTRPGTLARHGIFDWAARYAPATTIEDLWRLAILEHLAGRYPVSHNIARRRIPGIPWTTEKSGELVRWQVAWPAPFVEPVMDAVEAERAQHKDSVVLNPAFPLSIMREESSFIPDIVSYAGALGLMQLMHATAKDHDDDLATQPVTREQLRTADINIRVGVDHLYTLASSMGNHPVLMAASYNAGAGAVRSWLKSPRSRDIALWIEDVPYLQARDYTKRVIGSYVAYQWMLGADTLDLNVGKDAQR